MRIKLCGITCRDELELAERSGADAIGLLVGQVHAAADFVDVERASELSIAAPPFLTTVLVTHLEDSNAIVALAERVGTSAVQVHSDMPADDLARLRRYLRPRNIIGKVSVEGDASSVERARSLDDCVDAIVLDSIDHASDRVGGTGIPHDWNLSARITVEVHTPVILAGGLTPANVTEAIARVRPWAVDVNSGVEDAAGRKSAAKVRAFVVAARRFRPQ